MARPLYITSGEPAGIGPDICLSLAERLDQRPLVVLVDQDLMRQRAQQLGIEVELIEYHGQPNSCEKDICRAPAGALQISCSRYCRGIKFPKCNLCD